LTAHFNPLLIYFNTVNIINPTHDRLLYNKDEHTGCSKKTDPLVYFDDNFGKYGPILTIFSLLQQEIYDAQK